MPIDHISDTALWVAIYRAQETERADALFRDPFARRLAGPRGERIARDMGRNRSSATAVIVRTAILDEIIGRTVNDGRVDLIVNLAAGLDARPWRLPLPPALRWVDVDLPGILRSKQEALRGNDPACRYEAVGADLTDVTDRRDLLAEIGAGATNALVITEGLLVYLTDDQVLQLARDLGAVDAFRWWFLDLASPELARIVNRRWGPALTRSAAFQFAPEEGTAIFERLGWRVAEYRTLWDEGHRLRREMRLMWLWRLLSRLAPPERREAFRRMWGFVLLERAGAARSIEEVLPKVGGPASPPA